MSDFIISFVIPLAYVALGLATLAAIIFPFMQMFQDIKKAKGAFIGVGALIVIFLLCYFMADAQPLREASAGQMKMVEASLYLFYIVLGISVVAIIYSSVSRYFK